MSRLHFHYHPPTHAGGTPSRGADGRATNGRRILSGNLEAGRKGLGSGKRSMWRGACRFCGGTGLVCPDCRGSGKRMLFFACSRPVGAASTHKVVYRFAPIAAAPAGAQSVLVRVISVACAR